ncbi:MAG: hypothetical protein WCI01_07015 [Chlorobiaceae bacterium]
MIEINGFEYKCWHEVGHAVTCLHLGGNVEFIEFLEDENHKGSARARCETTPQIRPYVLCGGFATEYVLLKLGLLEKIDEQEFIQVVFKNASIDREMFFGKTENDQFTKDEDTEFMYFSIDNVVPIISKLLPKMRKIVDTFQDNKKIDGTTINKIL